MSVLSCIEYVCIYKHTSTCVIYTCVHTLSLHDARPSLPSSDSHRPPHHRSAIDGSDDRLGERIDVDVASEELVDDGAEQKDARALEGRFVAGHRDLQPPAEGHAVFGRHPPDDGRAADRLYAVDLLLDRKSTRLNSSH